MFPFAQFGTVRSFVELTQQLSDGTCNAVPGWEVTWEPQTEKDDPDCKAFPFFNERGLGSGASYGGK